MVEKRNFAGMKVLVMGLGLNGGGLESARYLAGKGAEVTVTDLKDEKTLCPSIEKLNGFPVRYVLGRHELEDFRSADMVIKNPGVRPDSAYLKAAKRIETDISLFLTVCPSRLLAVTGSKGKSAVSAALFWALKENTSSLHRKAWLGGNITISPLSFLDELTEADDVVLELSSWQLGDIRGRGLLKPRAAILTPIMRDHLDRYGSMEAYVADKRLIYADQDSVDVTVAKDDAWGQSFLRESRARPLLYSEKPLGQGISGGWVTDPKGPGFARLWETQGGTECGAECGANSGVEAGRLVELVPSQLLVQGFHQKQNLLAAALALLDLGLEVDTIRESLGRFRGIDHRLEFFHESAGIRFYNDSAATIPEAAAAAILAFEKPPILVTGGTDKELDFTPLAQAAGGAKALFLIAGTGTEKLKILLDEKGITYRGPFDSLDAIVHAVLETAVSGDTVILSPGCTSFGMFLNEFDRGLQWKDTVRKAAP